MSLSIKCCLDVQSDPNMIVGEVQLYSPSSGFFFFNFKYKTALTWKTLIFRKILSFLFPNCSNKKSCLENAGLFNNILLIQVSQRFHSWSYSFPVWNISDTTDDFIWKTIICADDATRMWANNLSRISFWCWYGLTCFIWSFK